MPDEIGGCKVLAEEWALVDEAGLIRGRFQERATCEQWSEYLESLHVTVRKVYIVLAEEDTP